MKVNLKCFSNLAEKHDCEYSVEKQVEVSENATVEHVIRDAGIENDDVKVVFVNGKVTETDHALRDGDNVTLVPATGGM
jgi:sulfur carrier protein ThiS